MNTLSKFSIFCLLSSMAYGCSEPAVTDPLLQKGVSQELAHYRKSQLKEITYQLHFDIPEQLKDALKGRLSVTCSALDPKAFILDFKAEQNDVDSVCLNGQRVDFLFENEHIRLKEPLMSEQNTVSVYFTCPDQSLNRRDRFLYTLLVPDRARTVFPCFDQPDLKATYRLSLELPADWKAVANGAVKSEQTDEKTKRTLLEFNETKPLSTYLFSFVAGEMYQETFTKDGRTIHLYHRENDPDKVAQCPEIADEVFYALHWMEEFTQIPYPFEKYDLIIVPGFQFGGMEHIGAVLYNDNGIFLNKQATLDEKLHRSNLIGHETSHMWFGDLVTMRWFDDVWTKEVFANYFGSVMSEPRYPEVNHQLNFMTAYLPGAYSEERTPGTNSIKQNLDNLANAGLVYGYIIYNKSPMVMNMLADRMGKELFQKGMQQYLQTYSYGNATWDDLIAILDELTPEDLKAWSHCWVNEKGRPTLEAHVEGNELVVVQSDEWGRGICWPQKLTYLVCADGKEEKVTVDFPDDKQSVVRKTLPFEIKQSSRALLLPNADAKGYGLFTITEHDHPLIWKAIKRHLDTDASSEVLRGSLLMNLYENLCKGNISAEMFRDEMLSYLPDEKNPLLYTLALRYLGDCQQHFLTDVAPVEKLLWSIIETDSNAVNRLQAFRVLYRQAQTPETIQKLYTLWKNRKMEDGSAMGETDAIQLSYELAIRLPKQSAEIVKEQASRITNPDRQKQYAFVSKAVSPSSSERDDFFQSLLKAENRKVEPWAGQALGLLNHPLRSQEAVKYIRPALDVMQEVQRTGDIFFPRIWAQNLFRGHNSTEAADEVKKFFADHPDYPEKLGNKIKQQAGYLLMK